MLSTSEMDISDVRKTPDFCGLYFLPLFGSIQHAVQQMKSPGFIVTPKRIFYIDPSKKNDFSQYTKITDDEYNQLCHHFQFKSLNAIFLNALTNDELKLITAITGHVSMVDICQEMRPELEKIIETTANAMYESIEKAHGKEIIAAIKKNIHLNIQQEIHSAASKASLPINETLRYSSSKEERISAGFFSVVKPVILYDQARNISAVVKKSGKPYDKLKSKKKLIAPSEREAVQKNISDNIKISLSEAIFREYIKQLPHHQSSSSITTLFGSFVKKNNLDGISVHQFMEKANGDLEGLLTKAKQNGKNLSVDFLQKLTFIILNIFHQLHSQKIFHRDIKAKNILFYTDPSNQKLTLKITDFGAAIHYIHGKKIEVSNTATNHILPPEFCLIPRSHIELEQSYSQAQDAWEIGMLLLDLWSRPCRHHPELEKNFTEKFRTPLMSNNADEKTRATFDLIKTYLYQCPDQIIDIITGLLKVNINSRFTMQELYEKYPDEFKAAKENPNIEYDECSIEQMIPTEKDKLEKKRLISKKLETGMPIESSTTTCVKKNNQEVFECDPNPEPGYQDSVQASSTTPLLRRNTTG